MRDPYIRVAHPQRCALHQSVRPRYETPVRAMLIGTVYLLHFDRPFGDRCNTTWGSFATWHSACGLIGKGTAASPLAGHLTRGSGSRSPGSGDAARCVWSA